MFLIVNRRRFYNNLEVAIDIRVHSKKYHSIPINTNITIPARASNNNMEFKYLLNDGWSEVDTTRRHMVVVARLVCIVVLEAL